MALTKPPVLPPWADAGDKVQPTNAEIQTGWPPGNTPPARQRWNWILNFLANGVRYLTRRGLPDYGADEAYMIGDRVIGDDGKAYCSLQDNNTNHTPSTSPLWWEEWAPPLSRLAELLQKQTFTAFTTAGAAPNFTLAPTPSVTAYVPRQRFKVKFHTSGTGADVLNVSALGNKSLKQYDSAGAKVAAIITANQLSDVEFDGVDMIVLNQLPTAVVDATETQKGIAEIATDAEAQAFTASKLIDGAKLASAFQGANRSLATIGYQKLPGGLIIQWGRASYVGGVGVERNTVHTFPIAFPTSLLVAVASIHGAGTNDAVSITASSLTGLTIGSQPGDSSTTLQDGVHHYVAMGY